jgi:V/A-type H+-transporting ATPase subunit I
MIVKMKKYSFLVYHKQYVDFLEKIREIGVLHVIEKQEGITENDALREKMQLAARVKSALKLLEKNTPAKTEYTPANANVSGIDTLTKVESAFAQKENLWQKLQQAEKEFESMEVWGEFSHNRLSELKTAGFAVRFFSCNIKRFNPEWEVNYNAFEIDTVGSTVYFITITNPEVQIDIDADPVKISKSTAPEILEKISAIQEDIEKQNKLIAEISINEYNNLKAFQAQISENIDFAKVLLSTAPAAGNKVMLLEGWCPEESETELNNFLEASDIYFETFIPTEEDKVPVKLKNNKFTRLFEMIGELYDLPNYHELDLTPFFAPFYMLFFGLCLGDVGYGLIFVIAAIILRRKVSAALKPVFSLVALLGISTVIMGAIGGNIFGYSLIDADIQWLEDYKQYMMDSNKLFNVALILGVIQIIFGMIIKAIGIVRRYGFAASLSTWGWLIIILGCGGTYGASTLLGTDPVITKYLLYAFGGIGGLMVFLLNDLKRNPFINLGAGLWDAYNMILGVIGDVLSYIRLFALGISGAVMGFVFNDLAMNLSGDIPVLSPIIMIIILLIGHGLNIFMSSLSAFVHPMRLTFVEFYKNSGFEGGGKKYKPFAAYKEENKLF